jgi:selenide,water dikinase
LIEARDRITPELSPAARAHLQQRLACREIRLVLNADIKRVDSEGIALKSSEVLPADFIIGAAGVMAWPWLQNTPLTTHDGYVSVDAQLRSLSHPNIFAAGDCAHLFASPRAKAGVFAVRAAPVLERNLRAALQGQTPAARFKPQRDYLKLISTGTKSAVAEKYGLAVSAPWLWRLKDRIDQDFMQSLTALTPMAGAALDGPVAADVAELVGEGQPLCGGCGSKTGRDALTSGLEGLTAPQRADVLTGPGDDAAVLKSGDGVQVITTDHLRAFTEDPRRFAEITAVHCLGDVWACGARPQAALATLILPPLSDTLQAAVIAEIMGAAGAVFRQAGADIVGGHTTTGAEMSLGFTVTGLAKAAVTQNGARPGDVLVLTKPIGTGVVLAGDMALRARGRDVAACWDSMARAQTVAADMLAPVAHAMTDVTGFGLAGHLRSLMGANLTAKLALDDIPMLPGAVALADGGVRSSLFNANELPEKVLDAPAGARRDLLMDPQTAGGLLAAIPEPALAPIVQAFAEAGEPVWRIGEVIKRVPDGVVIQAI